MRKSVTVANEPNIPTQSLVDHREVCPGLRYRENYRQAVGAQTYRATATIVLRSL